MKLYSYTVDVTTRVMVAFRTEDEPSNNEIQEAIIKGLNRNKRFDYKVVSFYQDEEIE